MPPIRPSQPLPHTKIHIINLLPFYSLSLDLFIRLNHRSFRTLYISYYNIIITEAPIIVSNKTDNH